MDKRLFFHATQRNRYPIGKVLEKHIPKHGTVLEIASGSGEHAIYFQCLFPGLIWQSSEPNPSYRESIDAWIHWKGLKMLMPKPIDLDVKDNQWTLSKEIISKLTSIVCINMLHVAEWSCTESLFKGARSQLKQDSPLILYGPFKENGVHTCESNESFDSSLKLSNKDWGVRDLEEVSKVASYYGFKRKDIIRMPANNLTVIFNRN
ncbi:MULTISPECIES: DUF938 domain-containing protein [Prochlorococcus]|uniref:DUF938 domain-containing protein n=1 Tax=Prochlorococcus TaxID=1218 RepID=UPI0005337D3D|nr:MULTISPECIES: DUF938 domain-containing protein [Prochlorococcus]KGG12150.1 SAM-dependent methyltransferase [Prochlorococcus sp. MIT 0601]